MGAHRRRVRAERRSAGKVLRATRDRALDAAILASELRIEREAGTVKFLPVRVTSRAERTSGVMEARLDRVALRFEVGTDPTYVATVVGARFVAGWRPDGDRRFKAPGS